MVHSMVAKIDQSFALCVCVVCVILTYSDFCNMTPPTPSLVLLTSSESVDFWREKSSERDLSSIEISFRH